MKKSITYLLTAVLTLGLLTGCAVPQTAETTDNGLVDETEQTTAPSEGREEPLEITMPYYPDKSLNPYTSMDYTNRAFLPLLYQGLFSVSAEHEVYPILCQRYTVSEDMKSHLFELSDKARFSDGTPVTAEDAAASLRAASQDGYYEGRFTHIGEISVTAEDQLLIRTDCAYEDLSPLLDIPVVKAGQTGDPSPIGSGPYLMQERDGQKILQKHSGWWCDEVPVLSMDSVRLVDGGSPREIRDKFEFSELNLVCADPGSASFADFRNDYELWDCENGIFLYLGCNLESKVFSNREVRQALPMAVNRDQLAEDFYRGFGWAVTLPASPRAPMYNADLAEEYAYNGDALTQALAGAKLSGSKIVLLTNSDDSLRTQVARAIAEMLRQSGLVVEVKECGGSEYLNALRMKEFDLYLGQTRLSPNMDLSEFFHEDGKLSFGPMNDSTMYALCLQSLENSGNYFDLYQTVLNDGRLCPILMRSYAVYATRGLLTDLHPARDNIFFYDLGRTMDDVMPQPALPPETTVPETTVSQDTEPETTAEGE